MKISADEQLQFLKNFNTQNLEASKESIDITEQNMYLQTIENDWQLYGKTASGRSPENMTEGWFVGFTKKDNQEYIFVTNLTSLLETDNESAGPIAKDITLKILNAQLS